jgi:hypothetical protein
MRVDSSPLSHSWIASLISEVPTLWLLWRPDFQSSFDWVSATRKGSAENFIRTRLYF